MMMAAQRDASWFDRPDVYSVKKYHIVAGDMMAACNTKTRPLHEHSAQPASEIGRGLRCQAGGCRQRWP